MLKFRGFWEKFEIDGLGEDCREDYQLPDDVNVRGFCFKNGSSEMYVAYTRSSNGFKSFNGACLVKVTAVPSTLAE